MSAIVTGALIGGGASLLGSALGSAGQAGANKTNLKIARESQQYDNRMWHEKNAYNSPEMQMQRMREAGLNPNLVAGGTSQAGNAETAQKAPLPQVQNELAQMAQMNLVPMLNTYSDMQVKSQQVKNLEADHVTKSLQNSILEQYVPWSEINARSDSEQKRYNASNAYTTGRRDDIKFQTESARQEIDRQQAPLKARNELELQQGSKDVQQQQLRSLQMENSLNEDLKPYGVTTRDALWERKLIPIIETWLDQLGMGSKSLRKLPIMGLFK